MGHFDLDDDGNAGRHEVRGNRIEVEPADWLAKEVPALPELLNVLREIIPAGVASREWERWLEEPDENGLPRKVGSASSSNPRALREKRATISQLKAQRAKKARELEDFDRQVLEAEATEKRILLYNILRAIGRQMSGVFAMGPASAIMQAIALPLTDRDWQPGDGDDNPSPYQAPGFAKRGSTTRHILWTLHSFGSDSAFLGKLHDALFRACIEHSPGPAPETNSWRWWHPEIPSDNLARALRAIEDGISSSGLDEEDSWDAEGS